MKFSAAVGSLPASRESASAEKGEAGAVSLAAIRPRLLRVEILALAIIVAIGLVHLPQPFHDDQTFFTLGGMKLSQGAVLYRDYWDIKQPGIFAFYWAGGKLFGFTEAGIHGFELLYMFSLAIVLIATLRNYFEQRWGPALAVLLTVGFYYGVCGLPHQYGDYLTNVEGLVNFPMFLALWFASRAGERDRPRWQNLFWSGVMGGAVLALKLMFLPILLCFWAAAFAFPGLHRHGMVRSALRFALPTAFGLAVPLALVCAYFAWHHSLDALYYTTFLWPIHALGKLPHAGPGRLYEALGFFFDGFAPLLGLGLVGTWWALRQGRSLLTINLLLWIFSGALVILVQVRSWWPYHFLLLVVPLGLLATRGVESLWSQLAHPEWGLRRPKRAAIFGLALILAFSPVIYPVVMDALLLARYRFALTPASRLAFQCRYPHSLYPAALAEIGFLSQPGSLAGPIYVGGSPLYYFLSGRMPVIALSYGLDDLVPEQWQDFHRQLVQARPVYVFLLPEFAQWIQQSSPQTLRFIEVNYRMLHASDTGTWYVAKPRG